MSNKTVTFLRQQIRKERQRIKTKPRRGLATSAYGGDQVPPDREVGLGSQPVIGMQRAFPSAHTMIGGRPVAWNQPFRTIVD